MSALDERRCKRHSEYATTLDLESKRQVPTRHPVTAKKIEAAIG